MDSHNHRRHLHEGLSGVATSKPTRSKIADLASSKIHGRQENHSLASSGWPIFEAQEKNRGLVVKRHEDLRITSGASYEITAQSLDLNKPNESVYSIHIAQLKYDADNICSVRNAIELNIKSIAQKSLDPSEPLTDQEVLDHFVSAHFFNETARLDTVHKISNAALVSAYIMSRIDKGIIPDIKRLLRLYKLI